MPDRNEPVIVHSLTEASLVVMLATCESCNGLVWPRLTEATGPDADHRMILPVTCLACEHTGRITFDTSRLDAAEAAGGLQAWADQWEAGQAPPINPTEAPSQAIDVAGWLALHSRLSRSATALAGTADRRLIRQVQIQTGDCLGEAMKFYDADNDLPPEDAFFTDAARRQFREHPDLFLRQRLVDLRMKLPVERE